MSLSEKEIEEAIKNLSNELKTKVKDELKSRKKDEPSEYGKSLVTALITVDGLILTLSWGLLGFTQSTSSKIVCWIKGGSILLLISLILGVLCLQFIVSASRLRFDGKYTKSVMSKNSVSFTFLLSWLTFIGGAISYLIAILNF